MTNQELTKLLCEHRYTDQEKREAKRIKTILAGEGFSIGYNCTIHEIGTYSDGEVHYLAGGSCEVSVIAIQREGEYEFNYYIVSVGDRGFFSITDFQERWLSRFEERCQKEWDCNTTPLDSLLYYLMAVKLDNDRKNNVETVSYVLHEGYCLRATIDEETERYKLEPVHNYGSKKVMNKVIQHVCHFSKPVFVKVECPSCHHTWMFDDSNIPDGAKYEVSCRKCGMILMRKKM